MGLSWKIKKLHRSLQNEMARYSSNFFNKQQIKVGIGKEWRLTSLLASSPAQN